ncbi:hypothetical protein Pcinc_014685 [Petrolisthes cinctipes]|uniref:Uncharacterized protein n=1 Tax=Petrolisthes cinctipes TaxID=88211 RepID=A0AAE1KRJ4_PETCI|nr:hypothetical protein Pcinc_014685 [Petrolisthes cinctipes]
MERSRDTWKEAGTQEKKQGHMERNRDTGKEQGHRERNRDPGKETGTQGKKQGHRERNRDTGKETGTQGGAIQKRGSRGGQVEDWEHRSKSKHRRRELYRKKRVRGVGGLYTREGWGRRGPHTGGGGRLRGDIGQREGGQGRRGYRAQGRKSGKKGTTQGMRAKLGGDIGHREGSQGRRGPHRE